MKRFATSLLVAALAPTDVSASEVAAVASANPIRKVVTLLQGMQKKVTEEGEKEAELFEKYMCYCTKGTSNLEESIAAAEAKSPQVGSEIKASEEQLEQAKSDLKGAQDDREAAKAAKAEAAAIREKEAATFAELKADQDTTVVALEKAIDALVKGTSFLQSSAATSLRQILEGNKVQVDEADRQDLISFLNADSQYAPQSGQIIGILKQMRDTMLGDLADATTKEEAAVKTFGELVAAKSNEEAALTKTVEAKTAQIGELGVAIVQMKEDLSDTEAAMLEDQKFLEDLKTGCSTKSAENDERKKTRAEELVALADTIKVLNDDDALDLFKKTLPSPKTSLIQLKESTVAQRARALDFIQAAKRNSMSKPSLDLLALALVGKKGASQQGFEKVVGMIDEMVAVLKKEQVHDAHTLENCEAQFDHADDSKKALERTLSQEETAMENAKEAIDTLKQEIEALEAGIVALDKSVADATEQRKAENAEYKELMQSDGAATELLGFAKNRLNKFYNPKLYVAPPKQNLSEEDTLYVSMGGTPPPTEAPGGIAGTGVEVFAQIALHRQLEVEGKEAPPPPPATWGAYATKSEETNGVIAMIDLLVKDLAKEMTEAESEEKNAQQEYEELMSDSAAKRSQDSKSLTEKGAAKADAEGALEEHTVAHKGAFSELMATEKFIAALHSECDWLMKYFEARKEARTAEIDSLVHAKAVLNGADYSLLQTKRSGFLQRRQ